MSGVAWELCASSLHSLFHFKHGVRWFAAVLSLFLWLCGKSQAYQSYFISEPYINIKFTCAITNAEFEHSKKLIG